MVAGGGESSATREPVRAHWLVLAGTVALGYVVGYKLAQHWFSAEDQGASFFPPAGLTLAALVLTARRQWPIVLGAVALAELALDLERGTELAATLGLVLANTAEPLVGALLLTSFVPFVDLRRTRDLSAFLFFAVIVAPVVGAVIAATTWVVLLDGTGWLRFAFEWWSGDGLGVLVVGSAILALRPLPRLARRRSAEAAALGAAATVTTFVVFTYGWFALVYVPVALLVVIAFRVGTAGVAVTGAAIAFVAAGAASEAREFWGVLDVTPANRVLYLQLGLAVVVSVALALAAEIWQRERMARALARTESERAAALASASLYEAERHARERAELLERHAAQLAATSTVTEVAEATIGALAAMGVNAAWVQAVRGDELEILAARGVPAENLERYRRYPLTRATPPAEAVRTARVVAVGNGGELERRFPDVVPGRRRLRYEMLLCAPLRSANGTVTGVVSVTAAEAGWLTPERRQLVVGLAEQCGLALERAQLHVETQQAAADAALLARLGEELERTTTTRERADELVRVLADELAAFACVHLLDEAGELELLAAKALDDGLRLPADELGRLVDVALATVGPVFATHGEVRAGALTLRVRARALGVLTVAVDADDRRVDTILLQRVTTRAALALDNAMLYERERDVSHELQLGLLGGQPPPGSGIDVASAYIPATEALQVGGDWYDVFDLPRGTRAFVVGDVVGHGLEAAKAMGQLRGAVRALAPIGTPTDLLVNLDVFVESVPEASMSTLAYLELDPENGRVVYACAGHPPPLVVTADGDARFLWDGRSTPLGSSLGSVRVEGEERLARDETVLLYTDGLIERRDRGLDAMLEELAVAARARAGASPEQLVDGILSALLTASLQDDVCVLAFRRASARHFSRSLPASPHEVAALRRALDAWLVDQGVPTDTQRDLVLAVSEVVANAAEHAYAFDGVGTIRVDVRREDNGALAASVADDGRWREPSGRPERGRGLLIVRALVPEVSIAAEARGTVVHLRLPAEIGAPT